MEQTNHPNLDKDHSFWHLTSIQMSGWISLPILTSSIVILQTNSFFGSAITILVANLILWMLRFGMIRIAFDKRQSTLDLAFNYFGKVGYYSIAILMLLSTFAWFLAQTTSGTHTILELISFHENAKINQFIQLSVFFGVLSTVFCMGGVRLLKKISLFAFPFLIFTFFLVLLFLPSGATIANPNPTSLAGLGLILAINLGFSPDLPTFFRHSRSWNDCVKGLCFIQLFSILIGLSSLYFCSIVSERFDLNEIAIFQSGGSTLQSVVVCFTFLSVILANIANVYSASVGWELFAPKDLVGNKEYFILGLALTTFLIILGGIVSVDILLTITDESLFVFIVTLLLAYFFTLILPNSLDSFKKNTYFLAWGVSTVLIILHHQQLFLTTFNPLLIGTVAPILFIGLIFSIRKLLS